MIRPMKPYKAMPVVLACSLALTVSPLSSLAFAEDAQDNLSTDTANEETPLTTDTANNAESNEGSSSAASQAKPKADIVLAEDTSVGVVSGSASVVSEIPSQFANQDGMVFSLDAAKNTATFIGCNYSVTDTLNIPAHIQAGGATYTVTSISFDGANIDDLTFKATDKDGNALSGNANPTDAAKWLAAYETVASKATIPGIKSITIPETITSIDTASFAAFPNAASITVSKENKNFTSFNGILFDSELHNLLLVPEG